MAKSVKAVKDCEVLRMNLIELQPASYNPRKMSVEAYQGLVKSIDKFGLLIPIVWNRRSGNVVGGHQRLRHLHEIGEDETDVIVVDLDDNEEVALNIALNNRAIRGDFTNDVVALLEKTEVQIGSAFNEVKLNDLFRDMNRRFAKELKEKTRSQEPVNPKNSSPSLPTDTPPVGVEPDPDAIITCPKCKSRWKMKNNEVVFDARTEGI
jgi:hypothetical protein